MNTMPIVCIQLMTSPEDLHPLFIRTHLPLKFYALLIIHPSPVLQLWSLSLHMLELKFFIHIPLSFYLGLARF